MVVTLLLVVGVLALTPAPDTAGRAGSASSPAGVAASPADRVAGLPVHGIPAALVASDPDTAIADLPVRPAGGVRHAYTGAGHGVTRVVVALNFNEPLGLPGATVEPDWMRPAALRGFKPLLTDHPGSSTTYLIAWSTTGRRWFIAVTAPERQVRMSALRAIATRTLPGT